MENKQQQIIKQVILNALDNYYKGKTLELLANYFTDFNTDRKWYDDVFYINDDDNRAMLLEGKDIDTLLFNIKVKRDHHYLTFDGMTGYLMGVYNDYLINMIKDELEEFSLWAVDHLSIEDLNNLSNEASKELTGFGVDYV